MVGIKYTDAGKKNKCSFGDMNIQLIIFHRCGCSWFYMTFDKLNFLAFTSK